MKRPAILFAIAVVVATNVAALGLAAFNRSSTDAVITLTERELEVQTWNRESTATTARLRWLYPVADSTDAGWFGCDRLTAIGFDCSMAASDAHASTFYAHQSDRNAFVVFESNGRAWEAYAQEMARQHARMVAQGAGSTPEGFALEMAQRSRLVAIDAGPDVAALRRAYPDRSMYLITAARVSIGVQNPGGRDSRSFIRGNIAAMLPDVLTVPPAYARALRSAATSWQPDATRWQPRYTITVSYGRRLEPWITGVTIAAKN